MSRYDDISDIPLESLFLHEEFKVGTRVKSKRGRVKGVVVVPDAHGPLVGIDPQGPDDMKMIPDDELTRVDEKGSHKRKRSKKKSDTPHPKQYSAPQGSKRDKQLDASKADLASGDPERKQRAYRRRERMEKTERERPGFKNTPRSDTKTESLTFDVEQLIAEKLSKRVEKTLSNKAKKRGLTAGSVKSEYRKGLAAWATSGSRKGMTQHQWAMARVNAATPSKPWAVVKKSKSKNESAHRSRDCHCDCDCADCSSSHDMQTSYVPQHPFVDHRLSDDTILRRFDNRLPSDEYVWHRDRDHRTVTVMEGRGWHIQFDNELPIPLREGKTYDIPRAVWHRVIKGDTPLSVMIVEEKRSK